jgi:hypothetical protein
MSVIVIWALGTTAPVLSVMVPKIEPYTACAKAEGVRDVNDAITAKYNILLSLNLRIWEASKSTAVIVRPLSFGGGTLGIRFSAARDYIRAALCLRKASKPYKVFYGRDGVFTLTKTKGAGTVAYSSA